MADYLAIDLEPHRVCGVLADVSNGHVRVSKTFAATVPEGVLTSPPETGNWLRKVLAEAGISATKVMVLLPREEVVVRHLELPPSSDDELPTIVRFQAATKSTVPLDQVALDFLPLPQRPDIAGRDVLLVTVPQERIGRLYGAAVIAGLEVVSVGVSSIATAELALAAEAASESTSGELALVVARHGDRVEMSVVGNGHLYFSHSTQTVPEKAEQACPAILAEISRSLVANSKRLPPGNFVRVWLMGGMKEDVELGNALKERFGCEVARLDPFGANGVEIKGSVENAARSAFAGPIGQLAGHSRETLRAVDFLNPRRPIVKKDYANYKKIAGLAAAVLLVISLFVVRSVKISDAQQAVADTNAEIKKQQELNKQMAPKIVIVDRIQDWTDSSVNWLDQAQNLAVTMDGTDRKYLTKLNGSTGNVKTIRGTLMANVRVKDRITADGLSSDIMTQPYVEIEPKALQTKGGDSDFPMQFDLIVNLKKADLAKVSKPK